MKKILLGKENEARSGSVIGVVVSFRRERDRA